MAELFIQLTIIIGIATLAALSVRLLRQPFIIAYLATGIVAGPALFNLLSAHQEIYDIFAHLGVILLLFVVGLSLNLNHIKQIGKVAVVVGIIQCIITSGLGFSPLRSSTPLHDRNIYCHCRDVFEHNHHYQAPRR